MTVHRPDLSWCPHCWGPCGHREQPEGSRVVAALVFAVLVLLGALASWAGVL